MYDVFYSSGRALLSGGVKCYAFWIHNNASSSFSSSFSSSIMGRHMWDWYFFVMRMRISIFSIHKVWCCMMYSITCYILLDLLCWRMMKNVLIFHVIVIPHRHFHCIEWWDTWWDWCNFGVRLRFFVFSIPTRYDVFYNFLLKGLLDVLYWVMMRNVMLFQFIIIIPHQRFRRHWSWGT